jgi:hypothetical protein
VAIYRVPSYTQNLDGLVYALPGEQWSRVEQWDPYLRFERCLSILFQDIRFVPVSYPGGDVIENDTLVTLSENEN